MDGFFRRFARLSLLLWSITPFVGCEVLNEAAQEAITETSMIDVTLADTILVSSPTATEIAAWYCPQYDPTGFLCDPLSSPPAEHELQFHFELVYHVSNPNEFPIPTTELLTAIELVEGAQQSQLGAVCTVLCAEGEPACNGAPGANSCQSSDSDIESLDDLANRVDGLLYLTIDSALTGDLDNLAIRNIPSGAENYEVRVRFSLGVAAMLDILSVLTDELAEDFLAGKDVAFDIPYSVHGTLWFEAPLLGRVAVNYGPFDDVWTL